MRYGYPMLLDIARRRCVIVGGGGVAVRKALGLLEAGATCVRAVAPAFDERMPPAVERVVATFEPAHLDGAGLVFAATDDPRVNAAVVAEAHLRHILACRADDDPGEDAAPAGRPPGDGRGDFATPAILRRGPVVVSVSAGGNPALAARVRDRLAEAFRDEWQAMAEVMADLRPKVLAAGLPIERRRAIFRDLAGDEALGVLARQGRDGLMAWLAARWPELPS